MSISEIVVWCVIGLLAGSLAGMVVNRKKEGYGLLTNLLFGLIGAFVGGAIFDRAGIKLGLGTLTIDLNQVAAAFVGALLVVLGAKLIEQQRQSKANK